jgi:hypothetical protein
MRLRGGIGEDSSFQPSDYQPRVLIIVQRDRLWDFLTAREQPGSEGLLIGQLVPNNDDFRSKGNAAVQACRLLKIEQLRADILCWYAPALAFSEEGKRKFAGS